MKGTAARMGVMKRVQLVFKAKANKALDKMEDPRETLDYSYQRQLELLTKVRRGVADVATSRKRVELQMNQLQQQANKLEDQARRRSAWDARTWPEPRLSARRRRRASWTNCRRSTPSCRPRRRS